MPRPCPPEFRERAVALVRAGKVISGGAAELGLGEGGLHNWVRPVQSDRRERPGVRIRKVPSWRRQVNVPPARDRRGSP